MTNRCGVFSAVSALLLFSLAWPSVALGQPVTAALSGVVLDSRTRQPLPGASVELLFPPQSATTDAEGRFRFEGVPLGSRELFVSVIGYAFGRHPVELPAEGVDVTVSLTEGAAAYNETVNVQGDVFGARESGVAGQQSLGSAELRQLGGMTLDDPLRAVQSLSGATGSDDFFGELAVRGHGFQRLNYILDGVPANFLLHTLKFVEDGASITMINGDVLDHVSLLRGTYPERIGPRLGAGLEFATSEGSRERTRYNLTASGTSASFTADGAFGASQKGSWLLSARRSYLDVFIRQVLDDSSLAFGFGDLLGKLVYDASERDQIQITALAGNSRFNETEKQDSPTTLDSAAHAGFLGSLTWRHSRSSATTLNRLTSRVFATGESFDNRNAADVQVAEGRALDYGYRMDFSSATAGRLLEAGGSIERLGARETLEFRVPGWHVIGGERFDTHAQKIGMYGQAHWAFGPAGVTLGTRADRFDLTGDWAVSPWLLADWQASKGLRLNLSAGLRHQFPEFAALAGRRGDPDLDPERAIHVDAGVEARLTDALRLQVTLYDREERNLVDLPGQYPQVVGGVLLPQSATSRYANRLEGFSRGVELMLQHKSPGGLSGWVAYAFARTRYTDQRTGERFYGDFDQRHTISVFGRYRLSDRMSMNARWRYGSNRPIAGYLETREDGRVFVGALRNSMRVPAYSRLDIRADRTYRWGKRRLTLFAEVANVLNRENLAPVPPSIDAQSGQAYDKLRSMFPIVPSLGAALEF